MPKQKFNQYGDLIRNYWIKCKACGNNTWINFENTECHVCGAWICPDCLAVLDKTKITISEFSSSNGASLTIYCNKCGYDLVDTDLY